MNNYLTSVLDPADTPQSEALPSKNQVKNNAGGFVFDAGNWTRLERFLVLGSEGGSYYATERELTKQNVDGLKAALAEDGGRFISAVVAFSQGGRAPKNDPALFALALAAADKRPEISGYALEVLPKVARIGTHLFHFCEYVQAMRGWGRGLRKGVANWYTEKPADKLAYQLVKYQSRDGWCHRDLLRLSHAVGRDADNKTLLHYAVKGWDTVGEVPHENPAFGPIWAFERAKRLDAKKDVAEMVRLIAEYNLPRECVPTEFLSDSKIWTALLEKMPVAAMIRNLGKMTSIGLIGPNSDAARLVAKRLGDQELLHKSRMHPLTVLMAKATYAQGRGLKGSLIWTPVPQVVNALDKAFYDCFANAPKTGKRFYIGLDVSGSMGGGNIAGSTLTPRDASAALAMVTMRTEDSHYVAGFTGGTHVFYGGGRDQNPDNITPLGLTPNMSLEEAIRKVSGLTFGSTDCALPMLDALKRKMPVDCFIIFTDNETWAGSIHPVQALKMYREKMGIDAKLIVVGMTATNFSIADPKDAGMLDVVGFDASVPQIIAGFVGGSVDEPAESEE